MKKAMAIGLTAVMAVGLAGCGGTQSVAVSSENGSTEAVSESQEETSTENTDSTKEKHSAEMEGTIDFEVTQGINEFGEKSLVLTYTNNTNHAIIDLEFDADLKSDRTSEEEDLLKTLQQETDVKDDDLSWAYFRSYNECYTEPGDTAKPSSFTFDLNTISDPKYYSLCDEATLGIIYQDGDKLYTTVYNVDSKMFVSPSPRGGAYEWFTGEDATNIPKFENHPTLVTVDEDGYGVAIVYNVSLDEYESYVDESKTAGFTNEIYDLGSGACFSNEDGIQLTYYYDSSNNTAGVSFNK